MVRDGPWNSTRFSYYGNLHRDFSLNITLHHNVIETWGWAYFTQPTNQTLRIIVTLSNNALATIRAPLATDHIDCHYKRPRWISLDHSVIEDWGWAHFTQTTNQTLWITGKLSSHALATMPKAKHHLYYAACLLLFFFFRTILTRYSSAPFVTDPRTGVKSCGLLRNGRAMTFISDRAYEIVQCAKKSGEKNRIDNALRPLWRVVAPSENFVETCKSPHMKRLSSCARTYPAVGYSCTPGGQERPKVAPLTYYGEGWPMKQHTFFLLW